MISVSDVRRSDIAAPPRSKMTLTPSSRPNGVNLLPSCSLLDQRLKFRPSVEPCTSIAVGDRPARLGPPLRLRQGREEVSSEPTVGPPAPASSEPRTRCAALRRLLHRFGA